MPCGSWRARGKAVDATAAIGYEWRVADHPGLLITFEGGEGSGKSLQAERLAARLRAAGHAVTVTREPGGTPLGEAIRSLLLHAEEAARPSPSAELLLFEAARAQLVAQVIRPALERGEVVVCDRFADSSLAYQGYARGLDLEMIRALNRAATGGLSPDLAVLLDLPVQQGLARRGAAGSGNSFDRHPAEFHEAVRAGYLALAAENPGRWRIVDASAAPDQVEQAVWQAVQPLLTSTSSS